MATLELGRRFVSLAPQDVANLLLAEMSVLDQEHLRFLLLNTRNEVLGIHEIYVGNVNSSVVRAAEVFRPAVQANAPSIIVVRNHPSGDPAPSSQDVDITNELISAGKLLGIELLDHVVLGRGNRFVSMNERRFAFTQTLPALRYLPSDIQSHSHPRRPICSGLRPNDGIWH